jgi:excisionase family DNA binding protein
MEEKFLRPDEIAKQLDVDIETVRVWLRRGELVGYKLGSDWRVKPSDLEEFLTKRRNVERK